MMDFESNVCPVCFGNDLIGKYVILFQIFCPKASFHNQYLLHNSSSEFLHSIHCNLPEIMEETYNSMVNQNS